MTKILDFISSKTFRNVMCFILFTFFMTVIISSQNFFFQKVIENGISKKDIVAQKDIKVIDTKKTEQHRKEVAQNVEPILTQAEDEFITTSLLTLQNSVKKIREKNVSDTIKTDELNVLFDESGKKGLVDFLLKSSDEDLQNVFDKSKITLTSVLNTGISNKDFGGFVSKHRVPLGAESPRRDPCPPARVITPTLPDFMALIPTFSNSFNLLRGKSDFIQ